MFAFLVNYDVRSPSPEAHSSLISNARDAGLTPWTTLQGGAVVRLPATTLTGQFTSEMDALSAFHTAMRAAEAAIGYPIVATKVLVAAQARAGFVISDTKR